MSRKHHLQRLSLKLVFVNPFYADELMKNFYFVVDYCVYSLNSFTVKTGKHTLIFFVCVNIHLFSFSSCFDRDPAAVPCARYFTGV